MRSSYKCTDKSQSFLPTVEDEHAYKTHHTQTQANQYFVDPYKYIQDNATILIIYSIILYHRFSYNEGVV